MAGILERRTALNRDKSLHPGAEWYCNNFLLTSLTPVFKGVCVLEFYILATAKVISELLPICDSAKSWRLYNAAALEDQVVGTMPSFATQAYIPATELTSPLPIVVMLSARLDRNMYHLLDQESNSRPSAWEACSPPICGLASCGFRSPKSKFRPNKLVNLMVV